MGPEGAPLYVLAEDRYVKKIVPVLYQPYNFKELSWVLRTLQYVDFTGDYDDGCRDLLRVWGLGYSP